MAAQSAHCTVMGKIHTQIRKLVNSTVAPLLYDSDTSKYHSEKKKKSVLELVAMNDHQLSKCRRNWWQQFRYRLKLLHPNYLNLLCSHPWTMLCSTVAAALGITDLPKLHHRRGKSKRPYSQRQRRLTNQLSTRKGTNQWAVQMPMNESEHHFARKLDPCFLGGRSACAGCGFFCSIGGPA